MSQEITTFINTVGFPISCVVATAIYIYKTNQQAREDNMRREERTFTQQENLANTLDKATDTINRINIRLDVIEDKVDEIAKAIK